MELTQDLYNLFVLLIVSIYNDSPKQSGSLDDLD